jgi:RNA polymerase sigma-70 factor (ECF subfamily)
MRPSAGPREPRFARLFNETRGDLLAYALRRAASPEDAADVLAETFLIAWQKLDSLPPGDEARLWLFGVARNLLRQGASRERALDTVVQRLGNEIRDAVSTFAHVQHKGSPRLRAGLKALPERQQEVLLLTAWEGLSPREIAAVTGTPVNLVRVRLHRARTRLRRELAATDGDVPSREPSNSHSDHGTRSLRVRAALDPTSHR